MSGTAPKYDRWLEKIQPLSPIDMDGTPPEDAAYQIWAKSHTYQNLKSSDELLGWWFIETNKVIEKHGRDAHKVIILGISVIDAIVDIRGQGDTIDINRGALAIHRKAIGHLAEYLRLS